MADELDQAETWALTAGLSGLWVEGYEGPKGGKAAGIGLCSDASAGLEKHKATGGAKLDIGHLVAGYLHMVIPGGFNIFCYLSQGWWMGSLWTILTLCRAWEELFNVARVSGWWPQWRRRSRRHYEIWSYRRRWLQRALGQ